MSKVRDNVVLLAAALALSGCGGPGWRSLSLCDQLQNPDPAARISATIRAGDLRDEQAVPFLVDRLTDSEAEERMYAILALKRITGHTFGYRHYEAPMQREQAVRRWRAWLAEREPPPSTTPPPKAPRGAEGGAPAATATTAPSPPAKSSARAKPGEGPRP